MVDEIAGDEVRGFLRETARRLVRTRSARAALGLLALLHLAAIFAPLLANDRPYRLDAVDVGAYTAAQSSVLPVANALARLVRLGRAEFLAQRAPGSQQSYEDALAGELRALRVRAQTLERWLAPADRGPVESLVASAEAALRGEDPAASLQRMIGLAQEIQDTYAAADPSTSSVAVDAGAPEKGAKHLVSRVRWPLFAALAPIDVFFMSLAFALTLFWAPRRMRSRTSRALSARAWCCVLGAPLILALLWRPCVGASDPGDASIQTGLASGEIVAASAWFPPIAASFASTSLAEAFRPPTWLASAEMLPDGGYAHGPRAAQARPLAVRVKPGEPALNAAFRHPLGTDSVGRDVLARILWGARISLAVGLSAGVLLTLLGTLFGLLAGWFGGRVDFAISRTIEVVVCFPAFFLVLLALFLVDPAIVPPIVAVAAVIALVGWTGVARLVRAEVLKLRELEFVVAARALGLSTPRILLVHVLPNALGPVLVALTFAVSGAILVESSLSFLGFGVQVPVPSWGSLVSDSRSPETWWTWLFPGACIFAVVVGYNLAGEALRDALDPRDPG